MSTPSLARARVSPEPAEAMQPSPTWRDFTWIDGQRYRVTERQRVDTWVPKPGDTSRNPALIHVAFMACRVEPA